MKLHNQNLNTEQAIRLIEEKEKLIITLPTLLSWARTNKLGYKVGGRWRINRQALLVFLKRGKNVGNKNETKTTNFIS